MLASLLPGVREVRAPLIAGYLWLLGLWIVFEPGFHDKTNHSELFDSLGRLVDLMSPIGLGVVVSVVAYLLGSMVITVFESFRPWLARMGGFFDSFLDDHHIQVRAEMQKRPSLLALCDEQTESIISRLQRFSIAAEEPDKRRQDQAVRKMLSPLVREMPAENDTYQVGEWLCEQIYYDTVREFPLIETRLLTRSPELFATVDRLRSEAELRLAIVWSLPAVLLAAALKAGEPVWMAGMAFITLLERQAEQRRRAAELVLSDALLLKTVMAPNAERLDQLIEDLIAQGSKSTRRAA